jgi:4-amino-4-deoxy-L-arabinose transferase-like glycosyltransferase
VLRARPLVVVLALALLARLAVVVITRDQGPQFDAGDYDRHAESIASGHGFPATVLAEPGGASALHPPTYPYLLGAIYRVFGPHVTAGRAAGALLGTVTVLLLYLVAREVWSERVALVAAALASVFPPLVMLNASLLSESLFLPLELGLVLAVLAYRRRGQRLRWAAAIGIFCGLAALTREVALLLVVPGAIGAWTVRPLFSWRALRAPAVVVLATVLTIVPWTLRNERRFHRFVPVATEGGLALAGTYNPVTRADGTHRARWRPAERIPGFGALFHRPGIDEARLSDELAARAQTYAWQHPGYIPEVMWWSARRVFNLGGRAPDESYREMGIPRRLRTTVTASAYVAFALALVGLIAIVRRALPRGPVFLWLVPLLMLAGVLPILGTPRYRAPIDPFIVLLAALGLVALAARRRAPASSRAPAARA